MTARPWECVPVTPLIARVLSHAQARSCQRGSACDARPRCAVQPEAATYPCQLRRWLQDQVLGCTQHGATAAGVRRPYALGVAGQVQPVPRPPGAGASAKQAPLPSFHCLLRPPRITILDERRARAATHKWRCGVRRACPAWRRITTAASQGSRRSKTVKLACMMSTRTAATQWRGAPPTRGCLPARATTGASQSTRCQGTSSTDACCEILHGVAHA